MPKLSPRELDDAVRTDNMGLLISHFNAGGDDMMFATYPRGPMVPCSQEANAIGMISILGYAIIRDNLALAAAIIASNPDLDALCCHNMGPLLLLTQAQNMQPNTMALARMLVEGGADPNPQYYPCRRYVDSTTVKDGIETTTRTSANIGPKQPLLKLIPETMLELDAYLCGEEHGRKVKATIKATKRLCLKPVVVSV